MPESASLSSFLQFNGVSKSFPGVRALQEVNFGVREGSVHALMGENGAGKSTLLKILSGSYRADEGNISLGGEAQTFRSTHEAIAAGVAVIYQELHLVPELSVAENLFLGHLPQRGGWLNRKALRDAALQQLQRIGENINPATKVKQLSLAQRQMVGIAKALSHDAKVIAFDEPTSSLSSREAENLFAIIEQLKQQNRVVLYVSHRMDEIYRVCDAATVFRDGRHVETFPALAEVPERTLIRRMVGREIEDVFNYSERPHREVALSLRDLWGPGLSSPVSLQVQRGEILGIFGLMGAGRTELLKLIYGATRTTGGHIQVTGQECSIHCPADAIRSGMVFCPEDRKREGIIPLGSVMENINLSGRRHFSKLGFWIDRGREKQNAKLYVDKLSIKTPSLHQSIVNLSGGNQQKAILGRWLSEETKVILLDEPTRGIDVGAKSEIYSIIYELASKGVAVILVSSDMAEVTGVCDRILVMREGELSAEFCREEATSEKLLQAALPLATSAHSPTGAHPVPLAIP